MHPPSSWVSCFVDARVDCGMRGLFMRLVDGA